MSIIEILQNLHSFVTCTANNENTCIQIKLVDAIKLYDYINSLEDKEEILYSVLGGFNNARSNK